MNPTTPGTSTTWPRIVAWAAVIGSTVPEIFWQASGRKLTIWFSGTESICILLAALAALWVPSLRVIVRFLIAVALLNFAWDYIAPTLTNLPAVHAVTDNASWGARQFLNRTFTLSGAVLVSLTLIGSGRTRRDLFLCVGDPAARAQPIPFLGLWKPVSWMWIGPAFMLAFALVLAPYLYLTVHPNFSASQRFIRILPWTLAVAAL